MDNLSSSIPSSPSKGVAVNFIENLRDGLFGQENASQKITFETLFGILVLRFGRILYQLVIILVGFFPVIAIISHIFGFILERCLEVLETEDVFCRCSKIVVSLLEIAALATYCYFLVTSLYAPVFTVILRLF